jgi:hypothetical protein
MTFEELKTAILAECTEHKRDLNIFINADYVALDDYPEAINYKVTNHRKAIKRLLTQYSNDPH